MNSIRSLPAAWLLPSLLLGAAASLGCSSLRSKPARVSPAEERAAGERALRLMFPGVEGAVTREKVEAVILRERAAREPVEGVAELASLAIQNGELDRARDLLGELLAEEHLERARDLSAQGDPRAALAALDRALEMAPRSPSILCRRAEVALEVAGLDRESALLESALADFFEASALAPDSTGSRAWLGASRAARALGRVEEAQEYARRGIAALPGSPQPADYDAPLRRSLAETSFDLYLGTRTSAAADVVDARARGTRDALVEALGHGPEQPWTWELLARLTQSRGSAAEARDLALRGLRLAPDDAGLFERLTLCARDVGGPKVAIEILEPVAHRHPDSSLALAYLARAHFDAAVEEARAGRDPRPSLSAAEASSSRAAALDPVSNAGPRPLAARCRSVLGFWLLDRGDLDLAHAAFLAIEELDPGSLADPVPSTMQPASEGLFRLAEAYGKRGDASGKGSLAGLERAATICDYLHEAEPEEARFAAGAGRYNRNAAIALAIEAEVLARTKPADAERALARAKELMERAARAFDDAVRLAPQDERVLAQAGAVLARYLQRDGEKARALLEKAVELGEQRVRLQKGLLEEAGIGEAEREARRALLEEQGTLVGDACHDLGALHLTLLGDPARAAQWLERSLQAGPDPRPGTDALLARCRAAIAAGDLHARLRDEDRWAAPLQAGRTP